MYVGMEEPTLTRFREAVVSQGWAKQTPKLVVPRWLDALAKYRSAFVPLAFVGMLVVIVVPMSPVVMDLLIAANIALAAIILLTTIYVESPIDFSVFPSLLLGTTLLRLVLNIASTRLILSVEAEDAESATAVAGQVIESFASFVAGNSVVVGVILFAILILVQFCRDHQGCDAHQ